MTYCFNECMRRSYCNGVLVSGNDDSLINRDQGIDYRNKCIMKNKVDQLSYNSQWNNYVKVP